MTRLLPIIAVILASLLLMVGAYMGAYYAMLEPVPTVFGDPPFEPVYTIDGAVNFFSPANNIDRLIRPGYWGDE
jgi:hypothetical protein